LARHRRTVTTRAGWILTALIAATGLLLAAWGVPAVASSAGGSAQPFGAAAANTDARASAPGVTATSVLIGSDQPFTGSAAAGYGEIAPASRAFFDFVNDHGGVFGRRISYNVLDDASNPATAAADERQLVSGVGVFAYLNGFGVTEHAAIVDDLNAQGVPDLFVGSSCECWNQPRQRPDTFGFGTDYREEGRLLGNYVAHRFPTAKIGYIWENTSPGCCQPGVRGLDSEIPASQVVTRQPFTTDELSVDRLLPQVRTAQAAGAQVLILDTLAPSAVALALLDAASMGYHPTILDTFRLSADPVIVGGLLQRFSGGKAGPALEDGLITQDYLPSAADTHNPWISLFRQIHDTYEAKAPFDNLTVYGMAAAYEFTRALRAAGPKPTRQSIVAAVNAGRVNVGGPGLVPLDYSPLNHAGYAGEQIGVVHNGVIMLNGPAFVTHDDDPIIAVDVTTTRPPRHF
jgi:ABC-type branched-subunit amino acid transport system substrate-binding protein